MIRTMLSIALLWALTPGALAQHDHDHSHDAPGTAQPTRPAQPVNPTGGTPGEPIFELDENGRPVELVGPVDLAALEHNVLLTDADRARVAPLVQDWIATVERTAAENIDLIVELRANILPNFNMDDTAALMYVNDSVSMLRSADTLTDYLEDHHALTHDQAQLNRRLVNDFQRSNMMHVGMQTRETNPDDLRAQVAIVTERNYVEALRDVFWVYDQMLAALAAHPGDVQEAFPEAGVGDDLDAQGAQALFVSLEYPDQKRLAELALRLGAHDNGS